MAGGSSDARFVIEFVDRAAGGQPTSGPPRAASPPGEPTRSRRTAAIEERLGSSSPDGGVGRATPSLADRTTRVPSGGVTRRPGPPPAGPSGGLAAAGRELAGAIPGGRLLLGLGTAAGAIGAVAAGVAGLKGEADELAPFSPEIALARAQVELSRQIQNLRDARRLGPEIAAFERSRGRLGIEFGRLKREGLTGLGLEGTTGGLAEVVGLLADIASGVRTIRNAIPEKLGELFGPGGEGLGKVLTQSGLATVGDLIGQLRESLGLKENQHDPTVWLFDDLANRKHIMPPGFDDNDEVDLDDATFLKLPPGVPLR